MGGGGGYGGMAGPPTDPCYRNVKIDLTKLHIYRQSPQTTTFAKDTKCVIQDVTGNILRIADAEHDGKRLGYIYGGWQSDGTSSSNGGRDFCSPSKFGSDDSFEIFYTEKMSGGDYIGWTIFLLQLCPWLCILVVSLLWKRRRPPVLRFDDALRV